MNFFVRARGVYVQAGTPEVAAEYLPNGIAGAVAAISALRPGETAEFPNGWIVHHEETSDA